MSKPKLMMVYDYEMPPHQSRVNHSSPYLMEEALKWFFDVYRDNEINVGLVDLVFNMPPLRAKGGTGGELFRMGNKTAFWSTEPLENLGEQYWKDCDFIFNAIPSWEHKFPADKVHTLLDAVDPHYKYHPREKIYDVGFLGSEIEATRINLLNKIGDKFKLLRGTASLGRESAQLLSTARLVLSIQDWNWHDAGIERRFFTFGNIRPIVCRRTPDLALAGFEDGIHYIGYSSDKECLDQIEHYLRNPDEAEQISTRLKQALKNHTFQERARTVHKLFTEGRETHEEEA